MPRLEAEPFAPIRSLDELFAVAAIMENEAVEGYRALAERMRREGRPDLVAVFERLVAEESRHLDNVGQWSRRLTGKPPETSVLDWEPESIFDDEGAASIAPELMSAYRAFSTAVRNEEHAFAFWTYVAAASASDELRAAAEQMAREELEHVATLRRERRLAFHAGRKEAGGEDWELPALERRLAELLDAAAQEPNGAADATLLGRLALEARGRADALAGEQLGDTPLLKRVPPEAAGRLRPAAELLLEAYLDLGERLHSESGRERAQAYAAQLLDCVSIGRRPLGRAGAGAR